ncbi:unnamed protein product [Rotaria magnacalcarata]|uniref:Uncharacterized protein n=3 Tax=Rotaria magnacalcarata TaxID=392030 RepID=A0A814SHU2_9BILA|nr:unnamed protein product [Rotaria magnacalcarata]
MTYLFVIWLGEKPIEKVFTSLRIILWSNVLNKILRQSKNSFLMMFDIDTNRSIIDCIEKFNLLNDEEQDFLEISSNDQREKIETLLKSSKFISHDDDQRFLVNIEHVDQDYLIKSSKETSVRIPDDNRLLDKLYTFGKILDKYKAEVQIIHVCDFQSQYQCELFVILSKIIYQNYSHLKQCFLSLAPAVIGDDRPSMKYDESSVDNYMKEVLAKIVNERAGASPLISMAVFKLQLICRKANSIVHLRSNLETNHDALFLLYTGARLISILNNYNEKYQNGSYPMRQIYNDKLGDMLMSKDEQDFLSWIDSFESRFLLKTFNDTNKMQFNLDKIFQEFVLFCRRLSPYYSKVRILTENQNHLLSTMFARLELIERIMHQIYCNRHLHLIIIFILVVLINRSISTDATDKPKQSDENDIVDSLSSETSIHQQTDIVTNQMNLIEAQPVQNDESKHDQIIQYSIEKESSTPENAADSQEENVDSSSEDVSNSDSEEKNSDDDDDDDDENIETPLTPEMEHANMLYHQAMKLMNVTINRQYESAYKLFKQAASLGHIGAKEELAFGHIIGVHLPMNFNLAKEYYQQGVNAGSPQSHYGLYFLNSAGLIPNASISKALVYLTFAAADGYHIAQMALAYRYWRSINVDHNCELALMYYQQAATYVASKITTASGLMVQRIHLQNEEEQQSTQNNILVDNNLLQYYQLLADRGDPQAQYGIGQLYYFRDAAYDKALYYFRLAAENGNINALAYLGKLYSEKNDFIKQNNQTALQFFQASAEKGNPIGQTGLGLAFYYGTGIEQNYERAFKLFQASAEKSYSEGQLMLGVMYYNGHGVRRDYNLAIKWFQAASHSGHVLGYYNLAQMHATGNGILRSCPTATDLFKIVAERGSWSNMFTEAFQLYNQGHIEQAFMIYLYLAEMGYEAAQANVAYIIDQMSFDISNLYKTQEERYRKALIYWNRAAIQGFHYARIKLGDYYFYGYGTEQNYELAAAQYKSASDLSRNSQAMFNLAYMHEKGLGLKQDMYLAKRFYDMALDTNREAYLPVALVLIKIQFELAFKKLFSIFFSSTKTKPTNTKENHSNTLGLESSWDIYLMLILCGLIGIFYTIRRQRVALEQQ